MDAPNRSPSPRIPSQPSSSSSASSPKKSDSPTGSPGIPKSPAKTNVVRFHRVKLNDAPVPEISGLSTERIKEVKDTLNQKTLFNLFEIWKTHNIVEASLKKLSKENKKAPEIPSLKQKLDATNKELNGINSINLDLLLYDIDKFVVDSDNKIEVEEFCLAILPRMKVEIAQLIINHIFQKEVASTSDYRTVNRVSSNMAQIFVSAFQKTHLNKIFKLDAKYSGNPEDLAKNIIKKLVKAVKENKDNDLLILLYSKLHSQVDAKFPKKGDGIVLSLIVLRYLGPLLITPTDGNAIPLINVQISKVIQSFISIESPKGMNLSKQTMDEGYDLLKELLPHIISKP